MNTSSKQQQFMSIDVDPDLASKVHFRSPYTYDPYAADRTRKEIIKAWNEECRIRETELQTLRNKTIDR